MVAVVWGVEWAKNIEMERRQVRFIGRVQGVGFRASTREIARGYGITGWVKNEADGSVLAQMQGHGEILDAFMKEMGSRLGLFIREKTSDAIGLEDGEEGFEIRY